MLARVEDAHVDKGPRDQRSSPERLCIATRESRAVAELIRFVVGPDGAVVPDLKRKLPGRGVWVTATRDALELAIRRQAFRKLFKSDVTVPADLATLVGNLLERAVLDSLAIARKAGAIVFGFTKVEAALAAGGVAALVRAKDASAEGIRKLDAAARRANGEAKPDATAIGLPIIDAFTTDQLDLALGRLNVVHAALPSGRAAENSLVRWRILTRFRGDSPASPDAPSSIEMPETKTE